MKTITNTIYNCIVFGILLIVRHYFGIEVAILIALVYIISNTEKDYDL